MCNTEMERKAVGATRSLCPPPARCQRRPVVTRMVESLTLTVSSEGLVLRGLRKSGCVFRHEELEL